MVEWTGTLTPATKRGCCVTRDELSRWVRWPFGLRTHRSGHLRDGEAWRVSSGEKAGHDPRKGARKLTVLRKCPALHTRTAGRTQLCAYLTWRGFPLLPAPQGRSCKATPFRPKNKAFILGLALIHKYIEISIYTASSPHLGDTKSVLYISNQRNELQQTGKGKAQTTHLPLTTGALLSSWMYSRALLPFLSTPSDWISAPRRGPVPRVHSNYKHPTASPEPTHTVHTHRHLSSTYSYSPSNSNRLIDKTRQEQHFELELLNAVWGAAYSPYDLHYGANHRN